MRLQSQFIFRFWWSLGQGRKEQQTTQHCKNNKQTAKPQGRPARIKLNKFQLVKLKQEECCYLINVAIHLILSTWELYMNNPYVIWCIHCSFLRRDPVIGRVIAAADGRPPRRLPGCSMVHIHESLHGETVEPFNKPINQRTHIHCCRSFNKTCIRYWPIIGPCRAYMLEHTHQSPTWNHAAIFLLGPMVIFVAIGLL